MLYPKDRFTYLIHQNFQCNPDKCPFCREALAMALASMKDPRIGLVPLVLDEQPNLGEGDYSIPLPNPPSNKAAP